MAKGIDWDQWFKIARVLPEDVIGDKKTGLVGLATSKIAFEKYIGIMTGSRGAAETKEAEKRPDKRVGAGKAYPCLVDKETLIKYFTKYQGITLLDDEEYYKLNPEYWQELGLVIER